MEGTGAALWLVDGYNLLHACLLQGKDRAHWWSPARQQLVVTLLEPLAQHAAVWVVFDAAPGSGELSASGELLRVVYAPDADAAIIDAVRSQASARATRVVTADRSLGDRAMHYGASLVRPWPFAEWLRHGPPWDETRLIR